MRLILLVTTVAVVVSACGNDGTTDASGDFPFFEGIYEGPFQEAGVSGDETSLFACDMRIDAHDQLGDAFTAEVYFLEGGDCANEVLWAATNGTIDANGNVAIGWDYSDVCGTFDGDTELTGSLSGNTVTLSASYTCDGWSYADTYSGTRD